MSIRGEGLAFGTVIWACFVISSLCFRSEFDILLATESPSGQLEGSTRETRCDVGDGSSSATSFLIGTSLAPFSVVGPLPCMHKSGVMILQALTAKIFQTCPANGSGQPLDQNSA